MNRKSFIVLAALLAAFLALAPAFALAESDADPTYTVTLDAQGGTIEGEPTKDYAYTGSALFLKSPERDGHTFIGWYTEPNGEGTRIVGAYTPTGDITLYANWRYVGYQVTFSTGGIGEIPAATYTDTPLVLPEPQMSSYELDGWYDSPVGGEKAESPFTPDGSTVLYAHWTMNCGTESNPLTSLYANYSMLCNNGTIYLRVGSPLELINDDFTALGDVAYAGSFGLEAAGHRISGPALKTGTFTFTVMVTELGDKAVGGSETIHTLTIVFTGPQPTYTVTLDARGGTVDSETLTFSGEPLELPLPTRSDYNFQGWARYVSDDDLTMDEYYGRFTETVFYDGDEFWPASDVTLHALWTSTESCTITFDANGGDFGEDYGGEAIVQEEYDPYSYEGGPMMPPEPSRYGYRFAGWYDQRDGGNPINTFEDYYYPEGDATLYAHWKLAFTGSLYYALPSIDAGALDACAAGAFYASVKGPVNVAPQGGYSVTGVTAGFGLSVEDGELAGTISKAGEITVTVADAQGGDERSFIIHSLVFPNIIYFHGMSTEVCAEYQGGEFYLPQPAEEGFRFLGWFTGSGERVISPFVPTEVDDDGDLHLYARWTVASGGTASDPMSTVRMDAEQASQINTIYAFVGALVDIQPANGTAVTRCSEGYGLAVSNGALVGMITKAGHINYNAESAENGFLMLDIYAIQPTYSVTLDPNGGKADIDWLGYLSNELVLPFPEWEGHTFSGWWTEPSGGTHVSISHYTPDADTILYAHWTLKTGGEHTPLETLFCDAQEALGASTIYVAVGGAVSVASSGDLTITGCTEGFGLSVEDGELAGTISQAGTITVTVTDGSRSGGTFTIVAPGTFVVGLGNHGDYGILTYEGTPLDLPALLSEYHTTFVGWGEERAWYATVPNPYTPTYDATLYPFFLDWVSVILYANGGSVGDEQSAALLYKGIPLEYPVPTWEGHTFLGWYDSPYSGEGRLAIDTPWDNPQGILFDDGYYVLYAHWALDSSSSNSAPLTSLDASVQEAFDAETIYVEVGSPVMLTASVTDEVAITGCDEGYGLSLESGYFNDMLLRSTLRGTLTQAGEITVTAEDVSTGATRSLTIFSVQPITVELDAMGGEIAGEEFAYLTYTDTPVALPDPDARSGFEFGGWYDWMVGGAEAQSPYAPAARTTLYARWMAETGSASNPLAGLSLTGTEAYNAGTLYVAAGGSVSVASAEGAVEIAGCTGGFGLTAAGGTLSGTLSKAGTVAVTADVYAKDGTHEQKIFTIASVTAVILNAVDGTVDGQSRLALSYTGTPLVLPDPDARNGFTFGGWYTWLVDGERAQSPYTPSASEMLYAHWIPSAGSQSAPLSTLNQWASDAYNAGTMYVAVGGWVDLKSEPSVVWLTGATSGFGLENVSGHIRGTVAKAGTITVTADVYDAAGSHSAKTFTVTAIQPNYTVTLNPNGGTLSTQTMTYSGTPLALPEPVKAGFAFVGWYDSGIQVQNPYSPTKNVTLFAQWSPIYTVTLDANGGTVNGAETLTMTYRGAALTLPTPVKEGMAFDGWYAGQTKVSSTYAPTGNVTLKAHWTEQAEAEEDEDNGFNWLPVIAIIIGAIVAFVGFRFHPAFIVAGAAVIVVGAVWALGWVDFGVRL